MDARKIDKTGSRRTARKRAVRKSSRSVEELEQLIVALERRIENLTNPRTIRSTVEGATGQVGKAAMQASHNVGELVADSLTDFADRVRGGATSMTDAARAGTGALRKVGAEMERRPLMTVAVALGIGFLVAMAGRREAT